jgi:hypothetical protein
MLPARATEFVDDGAKLRIRAAIRPVGNTIEIGIERAPATIDSRARRRVRAIVDVIRHLIRVLIVLRAAAVHINDGTRRGIQTLIEGVVDPIAVAVNERPDRHYADTGGERSARQQPKQSTRAGLAEALPS